MKTFEEIRELTPKEDIPDLAWSYHACIKNGRRYKLWYWDNKRGYMQQRIDTFGFPIKKYKDSERPRNWTEYIVNL